MALSQFSLLGHQLHPYRSKGEGKVKLSRSDTPKGSYKRPYECVPSGETHSWFTQDLIETNPGNSSTLQLCLHEMALLLLPI